MKKLQLIFYLFPAVLLWLGSCRKSGPGSSGQNNIVYVAGYVGTPGLQTTGVYWKNGVAVNVPNSGSITSMCLVDTNVYLLDGNTYWENGVPQTVPNAVFTKSIVVSGSDVYVVGATIPSSSLGYNSTAAALYFKDGVPVDLSQNVSNVEAASTSGLAISGSDVYVSAYFSVGYNDTLDAVYWKNDSLNYLPYGYMAKGIAVSNNNVYVYGTPINGDDVYWKNGVLQTLGPSPAIANCMVVSGDDVYVGGTTYGQNNAVYWKNGVEVDLTGGYTVNAMAVVGTDVYAAGNANGGYAVYWKNGVVDTLGIGGANAIAIGTTNN
jgi:hypothetical protein